MLLWISAGTAAAIAVSWLAAMLHLSGHAPLGMVSLGVGALLGVLLHAIAASGLRPKAGPLAGRQILILSSISFALLTAMAQHAWLYHDFRRQWHEARAHSAEIAMFRPESPWSPAEYFAHEFTPKRAALWALDAALIVTGSVAAVAVMKRDPK